MKNLSEGTYQECFLGRRVISEKGTNLNSTRPNQDESDQLSLKQHYAGKLLSDTQNPLRTL